MSLPYVTLDTKNAADCLAIQFSFYDILYKDAGFTYMILGQDYTLCVTFDNLTAVYYNKVCC
jgi:hypothetical protein